MNIKWAHNRRHAINQQAIKLYQIITFQRTYFLSLQTMLSLSIAISLVIDFTRNTQNSLGIHGTFIKNIKRIATEFYDYGSEKWQTRSITSNYINKEIHLEIFYRFLPSFFFFVRYQLESTLWRNNEVQSNELSISIFFSSLYTFTNYALFNWVSFINHTKAYKSNKLEIGQIKWLISIKTDFIMWCFVNNTWFIFHWPTNRFIRFSFYTRCAFKMCPIHISRVMIFLIYFSLYYFASYESDRIVKNFLDEFGLDGFNLKGKNVVQQTILFSRQTIWLMVCTISKIFLKIESIHSEFLVVFSFFWFLMTIWKRNATHSHRVGYFANKLLAVHGKLSVWLTFAVCDIWKKKMFSPYRVELPRSHGKVITKFARKSANENSCKTAHTQYHNICVQCTHNARYRKNAIENAIDAIDAIDETASKRYRYSDGPSTYLCSCWRCDTVTFGYARPHLNR